MKQKIFDIALQAGGSHYPNVGGATLEKFADLLIAECIRVIQTTQLDRITTYDADLLNSAVRKIVDTLDENFK
jgi:hypothetical protein